MRAATRIQSRWRGKQDRKLQEDMKKHRKPAGFHTHSLSVTKLNAAQVCTIPAPPPRRALYLLFEEPGSSLYAQIVSILVLGTIMVSIIGFVAETEPSFRDYPHDVWVITEVFCTAVFSAEYVLRLVVCDEGGMSKFRFIVQPLNVFDFAAIAPFYIEILLNSIGTHGSALKVFKFVRLIRLIRIFKLGRYSSGMQLMGEALKKSSQALSVLVFLLAMGVVLFSSLLFHAEKSMCPNINHMSEAARSLYEMECNDSFNNRGVSPSGGLCCVVRTSEPTPLDFPSIVAGTWWAMVTMTTVGYGDTYPKTAIGMCVGLCAMLVGLVLFALPVAIVGQKFQDCYEKRDLEEAKLRALSTTHTTGVTWKLTPPSNICARMRGLRVRDKALASQLYEFTSMIEDTWEQRERIQRERVFELSRQKDVHRKLAKMLSEMESSSMVSKPVYVRSSGGGQQMPSNQVHPTYGGRL